MVTWALVCLTEFYVGYNLDPSVFVCESFIEFGSIFFDVQPRTILLVF